LSVDDLHIRTVVHVEEQRSPREERRVGSGAGYYGQELTPRDLGVRVVQVCVFRGVCPTECSPYLKVLGPRGGVDCTGRRRRCRLEIEAEATEAGV
jgi:hypothetical protein